MGKCCNAFDQHWILFPCNLPRLPQWRTQERPKCAKNVLKWRTFELTGWITWKRLKIDGYMLRCVWQALNPLFIHMIFTAIVPWAYPRRPKCALGWLQKLTHVPLAIAILLVSNSMGTSLLHVPCFYNAVNFIMIYKFSFNVSVYFPLPYGP